MKKFLALLAALVLCTCTTIPVPAGDIPQPGEPMPDMIGYCESHHMNYVERPFPGYVMRKYLYNNVQKVIVTFQVCQGQKSKLPFGVLVFSPDGQHGILFLDNAPCDGIVDEVIHDPIGRSIQSDMPDCV